MHAVRSWAERSRDAGHQLGILVIERDPDLQWHLARSLTVQGHRVVGTSSGEGALALIAEWPVDLVLVDEDLPRTSGLEVAEHIRRSHPEVPVVLIMADPPARASRLPGVVASLAKPFSADALHEMLESVVWSTPDPLAEPAE
jgi:DNA-binding NtrC family response regulator